MKIKELFQKKERAVDDLELEEGGSKKRELTGFWKKYVYVLGIIAAAAVANFLHWGIAAVNAMVVSAIFFFIGELTGANK